MTVPIQIWAKPDAPMELKDVLSEDQLRGAASVMFVPKGTLVPYWITGASTVFWLNNKVLPWHWNDPKCEYNGCDGTVYAVQCRRISVAYWLKRRDELFGQGQPAKFKCPECGHVQTDGDYKEPERRGYWKGDWHRGHVYLTCLACGYSTLDHGDHYARTYVVASGKYDANGAEYPVFEFAESVEAK